MGAWKDFLDGLRAGRYNAELTKSTMKRGKALPGGDSAMSASSDKSGSSFSDSDARGRASARTNMLFLFISSTYTGIYIYVCTWYRHVCTSSNTQY